MVSIESLRPGARVSGIIPGESSTIVVVTPLDDAISQINWRQGPKTIEIAVDLLGRISDTKVRIVREDGNTLKVTNNTLEVE